MPYRSSPLLSLLSALIFTLFLPLCPAQADSPDPALQTSPMHEKRDAFARDFATKVLSIIQDPKKSYSDRKVVLRQAFSNSVDIDWIAHFVLGAQWNQATDEQKQQYSALYRQYLTETYIANFAENPDKRIADIKILGVNDQDDTSFTVSTEMRLADRERLNVTYRVADAQGTYKVLDIAIENISLITTHRAEFTQLAATKGISGVIAKLQQATQTMKLSMN
jgi:phospholipid transport system substrate-binding protein